MRGLFITGVGTGVGKTLVTTILGHQLRAMGLRVNALKPVVSGYRRRRSGERPGLDPAEPGNRADDGVYRGDHTVAVRRHPLSPHLAARREGRSVSRDGCRAILPRAGGRREFDPADRGRGRRDVADDLGCDLPRSDRGPRRSRGPRDRHLSGRAQPHPHGPRGIEGKGRDACGGSSSPSRPTAWVSPRRSRACGPSASRTSRSTNCPGSRETRHRDGSTAPSLTKICEPDHA